MKTLSVLFLVPYPLHKAPSQRFRVELFLPVLTQAKIVYSISPFISTKTWHILYRGGSFFQKAWGIGKGFADRWITVLFKAWKYEYIFIHREAAPIGPPVYEWILCKLLRKKIIYDFDDAIWIPNTSAENSIVSWFKAFWKVHYICRWSYKISAGNNYLCDFAKQYNKNVNLVPTCVDTDNQHNRMKEHSDKKAVVGWTGSHSTLKYLDAIVPLIAQLQDEYAFSFLVISDKKPDLHLKDWVFIPWQEQTEVEDLLKMDIGIMPLTADAWSEGKCGFKLIQYFSVGIPAVASPVGVNKTIVENGKTGYLCNSDEEWKVALVGLITDANLRKQMGLTGRTKIEREYSTSSMATTFLNLFS